MINLYALFLKLLSASINKFLQLPLYISVLERYQCLRKIISYKHGDKTEASAPCHASWPGCRSIISFWSVSLSRVPLEPVEPLVKFCSRLDNIPTCLSQAMQSALKQENRTPKALAFCQCYLHLSHFRYNFTPVQHFTGWILNLVISVTFTFSASFQWQLAVCVCRQTMCTFSASFQW